MKSSAHGTPCASKGARTVWGGAKDLKGSDLSPFLFMHEYSAQFLLKLWKRVRKYGAFCTGITQNVLDLLQSHTARTMLSNSEFIVMLNQAATDRQELAKLLNISDRQLSYITNVDAGHGLIKVGSALVPFENKFPKDTKLYKLMTTKPGEGLDLHDEQEVMKRIREVAEGNSEFGEIMKKYLSESERASAPIHKMSFLK